MDYHIRKIKTDSNNYAIQVVTYKSRKRVIEKHIGTAHNRDEINLLYKNAEQWISEQTKQLSLFKTNGDFVSLEQYEYLGFQYNFLYETLINIQTRLGYISFGNKLLNDLVNIRIIEPASKLRSLELLKHQTSKTVILREYTLYSES